MNPRKTPSARRKAFTLMEIMVAFTIVTFVSVGLYAFSLDTSRILFTSAEKLDINHDVRLFTSQMSEYARAANHFFVYTSFRETDRNEVSDRVRDGETGDFLLLIYERPYPDLEDPEHVFRLIGYFRRPEGTGTRAEGPVYRFQIDYVAGSYPNTLDSTPEQLISGLSSLGDFPQVLELARGLADGKLFYNFYDRSIMVKAELIHGNAAKRVTDTYNFTVSPRG